MKLYLNGTPIIKDFSEMTLSELLSVKISELTIEESMEHDKWLDIRVQEEKDSLAQY